MERRPPETAAGAGSIGAIHADGRHSVRSLYRYFFSPISRRSS